MSDHLSGVGVEAVVGGGGIEEPRAELGDASLKITGSGVREPGRLPQ